LSELLDAGWQMMLDQLGVGAHDEVTPPFGMVHLSFQGIYRLNHRTHQFQKVEALGGQSDWTLDSVKEGDSELMFQLK